MRGRRGLTEIMDPAADSGAVRKQAADSDFIVRIYRLRVLGLGLGALCIASVLAENGARAPTWALLAASGLVWPHVAFLLSRSSPRPRRAERLNLIVDSVLGGIWIAVMQFNLLPSFLLFTMLTIDKIFVGGWRLLSRSASAQLAATAAAAFALGFPFRPATSMTTVVVCLPFLLLYPLAISTAAHGMARSVHRQNRLLAELNRTEAMIATGTPLEEVLERLALLVESDSEGMSCSILLLSEDGRHLRCGAAPSLPDVYNKAMDGLEIGDRVGSAGTAAFLKRRVVVEDVQAHPDWTPFRELTARAGFRSCWSEPILDSSGKVLGAFTLHGDAPGAPSPAGEEWAIGVARLVSNAITRFRALQALRESEAFFSAAFRRSPLPTTISDLEDGRYVDVNDAFLELTGYSREEVVGRTTLELGIWADSGERDRVLTRLREQGRLRSMEVRYRTKAGETGSSLFSAERVSFRGRPCLIVLGQDVTELRRAEGALTRAQKLEALGKLAGGIAHDFNNLLLAISGNVRIVLEEIPAVDPLRDNLQEIEVASERAARLVHQILTFSTPRGSMRSAADIRTVVEEALRLLRSTLPAMIALRTRFADDLPAVACDSTQLHQVVVNLGTNAAYAIGTRSGHIEFRLEAVDVDAVSAHAVEGLREGRWVRLSVADDGCGMNEATLHRIFDPFFTTKPQGQGSGLGLSVVHGIVRSHDAAIAVESRPGEGSTFHLYFPPAADAARAEEKAPEPGAPAGQGERVLYVDDEPALIALARRGLQQLGFRVDVFSDPAEALRAFEASPGEFDAVVTDMAMPGMSGLELSKALLAIRGNLPILLTSGFLPADEEERALRIGVREILHKPHSVQALGIAVQRVLAGT